MNDAEIEALTAERDELRKVLSWYADEENWPRHTLIPKTFSPAVLDAGWRARAALEGQTDE